VSGVEEDQYRGGRPGEGEDGRGLWNRRHGFEGGPGCKSRENGLMAHWTGTTWMTRAGKPFEGAGDQIGARGHESRRMLAEGREEGRQIGQRTVG